MVGWDLITALVVISTLSVFAYLGGRCLGRSISQARALLFAVSLGFTLVFAWFYSGRLLWAAAIPVSGVVYWSNLMPVFLAFAAGLALATPGLDRWRRPVTMIALVGFACVHLLLPIARPILAPALIGNAVWRGRVCMQSHEATCGAAAAATLLNLRGIPATEREMVPLCLTSRHGTVPLGLYRGLKIASQKYDRDVRIASSDPSQWQSQGQLPNVALIRFDDSNQNRAIGRLLGPRGEGHAITVVGYTDGKWVLGDPAVGKVRWTDSEFRRRFTGDAIYLSRR